jgi:hypothetical protein
MNFHLDNLLGQNTAHNGTDRGQLGEEEAKQLLGHLINRHGELGLKHGQYYVPYLPLMG